MNNNELEAYPMSFLGIGWSFPPTFGSAGIQMVSEREDIEQSLRILFSTQPGERVFHPKYGIDLQALQFEPLTVTMRTWMQDVIQMAILVYEPRIRIVSLVLDTSAQQDGYLVIDLDYEIRSTNSRYNLVYSFSNSDANEVRSYFDR